MVFAIACAVPHASAEVHVVDSLETLAARIKTAAPGDTVVMKNGTYTTERDILVECAGTAELPIIIRAESIGGVEIAGAGGFDVEEPALHVAIAGFVFTHASGKNTVGPGTRHVRFTRNTFRCVGDGHFLSVSGDDMQIDFNDFGPKTSPGTMIAVSGTGSQVARRIWIHRNYFHDFANDGSGGAEMIRFGLLSAHRLSVGAGLVEHNLFVGCRGTNEMISNRSSGNTYRYNTFLDSPTSHLTVRQGNDCAIYGNVFRNTEGLRFHGDRHRIYSNYFEGNYIAVAIGNGDIEFADVPEGASPNSRDRPDACAIVFNTFVGNATHLRMSKGAAESLGARGTVFANNLIVGGDVAAKIDGRNEGAVWAGNVLWATGRTRDLPREGHSVGDPLLSMAADGLQRPAAESPVAAAAADGKFSFVTVDLSGLARPEKKAVGADEPGMPLARARQLSVADVGPTAGLGATGGEQSAPKSPAAMVTAETPSTPNPDVPAAGGQEVSTEKAAAPTPAPTTAPVTGADQGTPDVSDDGESRAPAAGASERPSP
jgi:poly(beta-D-mannuronate) lyase